MRSALTIIAVAAVLAGFGLTRYGSLDPCVMLRHDVDAYASDRFGNAAAGVGVDIIWQQQGLDRLDSYACARALKRLHLGQRPLFPADAER
jgi:hypothetical protein